MGCVHGTDRALILPCGLDVRVQDPLHSWSPRHIHPPSSPTGCARDLSVHLPTSSDCLPFLPVASSILIRLTPFTWMFFPVVPMMQEPWHHHHTLFPFQCVCVRLFCCDNNTLLGEGGGLVFINTVVGCCGCVGSRVLASKRARVEGGQGPQYQWHLSRSGSGRQQRPSWTSWGPGRC
mgnify:CR=1 FL=1